MTIGLSTSNLVAKLCMPRTVLNHTIRSFSEILQFGGVKESCKNQACFSIVLQRSWQWRGEVGKDSPVPTPTPIPFHSGNK